MGELLICTKCGGFVSSGATRCPVCGRSRWGGRSISDTVMGVFVLFAVLGVGLVLVATFLYDDKPVVWDGTAPFRAQPVSSRAPDTRHARIGELTRLEIDGGGLLLLGATEEGRNGEILPGAIG